MAAERLGNFNFFAGKEMHKLQGVDDSFGLEMIVGDDESFAGRLGNVLDALGPRFEFRFGVEVVVAFGGRGGGIVGGPGVVAAAVKANVADRGGHAFTGLDGATVEG